MPNRIVLPGGPAVIKKDGKCYSRNTRTFQPPTDAIPELGFNDCKTCTECADLPECASSSVPGELHWMKLYVPSGEDADTLMETALFWASYQHTDDLFPGLEYDGTSCPVGTRAILCGYTDTVADYVPETFEDPDGTSDRTCPECYRMVFTDITGSITVDLYLASSNGDGFPCTWIGVSPSGIGITWSLSKVAGAWRLTSSAGRTLPEVDRLFPSEAQYPPDNTQFYSDPVSRVIADVVLTATCGRSSGSSESSSSEGSSSGVDIFRSICYYCDGSSSSGSSLSSGSSGSSLSSGSQGSGSSIPSIRYTPC